jgi:hypothetical protein
MRSIIFCDFFWIFYDFWQTFPKSYTSQPYPVTFCAANLSFACYACESSVFLANDVILLIARLIHLIEDVRAGRPPKGSDLAKIQPSSSNLTGLSIAAQTLSILKLISTSHRRPHPC